MRSPNYPAFGLTETTKMAKSIWDKEERTVISPEVAVKALGYQSMSGVARTKLGSLRKFGLLEDVSNGGVRISELAMRLIHHGKETPEYQAAIKEAALKPELYKELYGTHAKASDDAIRSFLKVSKAFSESGADQFVEAFRETLKLANLNGEAYTPNGNGGKPPQTPAIGDTVQWESAGVQQFPTPRRIRALDKSREWAFVDGSETGLPIKELTVVASATPESHSPQQKLSTAKPPTLREETGTRRVLYTLEEGDAMFQWPAPITPESAQELEDWLEVIKRRITRSVKTADSKAEPGA